MDDRRYPTSNRIRLSASRRVRAGATIVLASVLLASVVAACACSRGPGRPAEGTPEYTIDSYLRGLRTHDATLAIVQASPEFRQLLPRLPEQYLEKMNADDLRLGKIERWKVSKARVDEPNQQAFLTVDVGTQRFVVITEFELRKIDGRWLVYSQRRIDMIKNPEADLQPSDLTKPPVYHGK